MRCESRLVPLYRCFALERYLSIKSQSWGRMVGDISSDEWRVTRQLRADFAN